MIYVDKFPFSSITSFSITCCTEQTDIPYRTAEHYSYVHTAAVTSGHNPHCKLTALHMTVGSAAIPGIPCCDESSLVLWQLILYTGQGPTAVHYLHVARDTQNVWRFWVHLAYTRVCVYMYIHIYISFNTGLT